MSIINYFKLIKKLDMEFGQEEGLEKQQLYFADDLGIIYSREKTTFRVWAPTAEEVSVFLYEREDTDKILHNQALIRDINGTWYTEIKGDLNSIYHSYQIKVNGQNNMVVDPYTRGLGTNSKLGLVVDLQKTNPLAWDEDKRIHLIRPQDAVIYEVQLRDFSSAEDSGIYYKNKYLAFTETGTVNKDGLKTGIDHLKELGVTHVHLLPVFDFATVNDLEENDYNWGYDPYYYNVPEGSYSTNPADDTRIIEFKLMVKALHDNGLGIIMDVVYNHTYHTENSPFNKIVPGYFYRKDFFGNFSNGSGTGNEIASEKPMVRKFIVDSVKYWAEEYHIDGFRFDLMALHDRITMSLVEKTLHNIDPSIIIYGEPWTGGWSPLKEEERLVKGNQRGMKIGVFNDNFRNAIKGDNDGKGTGFVSGAEFQVENIKRGVVGSIFYNLQIRDFAEEPSETVNYVSSHDNLTLWDKLQKSNYYDSEEIRIRMDKLAQGIILTSQGIPFIQGGEEFLRTKFGNHNSYKSGDYINQLKWDRKGTYYDVFKYYRGLITLRKEHPAFRLKDAESVKKYLKFLETPYNTIGFILGDFAGGDPWKQIVVFYNPLRETVYFRLPYRAQWSVVVDDSKTGVDNLYSLEDEYIELSPISMMVLYHQ